MKTTSSDYKYQHLGTVFRLVDQFELISRTDLAKLSGFAPASMTLLTKALIDNQLIIERTSQNLPSRGRPAVGLSISTFNWHSLCLIIAPNKLSIALCDLAGNAVSQLNYTFSRQEYAQFEHYIVKCLQNFYQSTPLATEKLLAVSVSVIGKINTEKTSITQLGNHSIQRDIVAILQDQFKVPILLNEHFSLWFLAESTLGSLIRDDNAIFLQLSDTIELSVLLKGELLHHAEHKRMNVDKMVMPQFSPLSQLAGEGLNMIERYQLANQVTFPALAKLIDHALPNKIETTNGKITYFCEQVLVENRDTVAILEHISDNLAYVLMNLINIFSTEKIMIHSPLLAIKQPLFEQIQQKLRQNLLLSELKIDLVSSQHAWNSPLIPSVAIKLGLYNGHLLKNIVTI